MELRWTMKPADEATVQHLQQELKIHPALCRVLAGRGINTFEKAKHFFRPSLTDLHDPFLMKGMQEAIARLTKAIQKGEKILVYGDYDVDGTTAVATVYSFLKDIHPATGYYIPHRYIEGYGISFKGIDYAAENGYTLIIALDCGIKANDKVQYATEKGIDFIICDHHQPGDQLPAAVAVLDPKRNDCPYPYKELSGCGIGFKLIQAFVQHHQMPEEKYLQYLDLVCVSIGSDIVPIDGENRILAFFGLQKINTSPSPGLKALLESAGVNKELDIDDVVFIIGPRINAAGRIDDARHAVKVLLAEEADTAAAEQAYRLNHLNAERKNLDRSITAHALELLSAHPQVHTKKSTVVYHPEWHKGVIGIVASRLTETYYRPTVVLTHSDGKVTGSARSVKGFDLYEAIYECREHLIQFGGHRFAAGLTMYPEAVDAFAARFEEVVSTRITEEQLIPELETDAEISLSDITPAFYNIVKQMAPFGPANMKPVFVTHQLRDTGWSKILKEEHIKFSLRKADGTIQDGIGFGLAQKFHLLKKPFSAAYHIQENYWQGKTTLQLVVKDIREV